MQVLKTAYQPLCRVLLGRLVPSIRPLLCASDSMNALLCHMVSAVLVVLWSAVCTRHLWVVCGCSGEQPAYVNQCK